MGCDSLEVEVGCDQRRGEVRVGEALHAWCVIDVLRGEYLQFSCGVENVELPCCG